MTVLHPIEKRSRGGKALLGAILAAGGCLSAGSGFAADSTDAPSARPASADSVCVAYFTWWENTRISREASAATNPEAVSGASLQAPGHVGRIALRIAGRFGVEAFAIRAAKPYPSDYPTLLAQVQAENASGTLPALDARGEAYRLGGCRTLFLGFPNWDYDMPPAVKTFVKSIGREGWSGRTIRPFASTGTGGWAHSLETLRALAPGARIESGFAASRSGMRRVERRVDAWLDENASSGASPP